MAFIAKICQIRLQAMPANTSMNISLPEPLKEFVKQRVQEQHYSNPSDYIRALIRDDQKKQAQEKLEKRVLSKEDLQALKSEMMASLK